MSYILEALKKGDKSSGQGLDSDENPTLKTQSHSPVGQTPLNQSYVSPTVISNQSISWGVLLTLAIFSALLAGFWLGQQKSDVNEAQILPTSNVSTKVSETQSEAVNTAPNARSVQVTSLTDTVNQISPPKAKIAAEDYFENPPTATKSIQGDKSQSALTDNTEQQPLEEQKVISVDEVKFDVKPTDGVSDDLLARFQTAIEETGAGDSKTHAGTQAQEAAMPLTDMPEWVQEGVPSLNFEMHIYASDGQGWIRVNGNDKYEGQQISKDLSVEKILPQKVVLNFRGELFTLAALSTWK